MKSLVSAAAVVFVMFSGHAFAQTAAERQACQADFEKYCPDVKPGDGRVVKCLGEHLDQLTPQCRSVVEANTPK